MLVEHLGSDLRKGPVFFLSFQADHIPWLMVPYIFKTDNCRASPSQPSHLSDLSFHAIFPDSLLPSSQFKGLSDYIEPTWKIQDALLLSSLNSICKVLHSNPQISI